MNNFCQTTQRKTKIYSWSYEGILKTEMEDILNKVHLFYIRYKQTLYSKEQLFYYNHFLILLSFLINLNITTNFGVSSTVSWKNRILNPIVIKILLKDC